MKKATKKIEKVDEPKVEEPIAEEPKVEVPQVVEEPKKPKIDVFSGDFGQEEMNRLRDKVNEIINFIN